MATLKKPRKTRPEPRWTTSAQQQISCNTIAESKSGTVGLTKGTVAGLSYKERFRSRTACRAVLGSGDCVFQPKGTSRGSSLGESVTLSACSNPAAFLTGQAGLLPFLALSLIFLRLIKLHCAELPLTQFPEALLLPSLTLRGGRVLQMESPFQGAKGS